MSVRGGGRSAENMMGVLLLTLLYKSLRPCVSSQLPRTM